MERSHVVPLLIAAMAFLVQCATEMPSSQTPSSEATFVFRGSVKAPQSSTLEQLEASGATYSVVVEEVLYQAGSFVDLSDRTITVISGRQKLEPGSRLVFYTEPVMFGESVAVQLIRAGSDDRPATDIGGEVKRDLENGRLRERVREAEIIVVGSVESVNPAQTRARIESEHLPELHQATVTISEVLKGQLSADQVAFLFAQSRDIQWYQSPKLSAGDEGVFLLNRDAKGLEVFGVSGETLTLLHPLDFQPRDKVDTIKGLL